MFGFDKDGKSEGGRGEKKDESGNFARDRQMRMRGKRKDKDKGR